MTVAHLVTHSGGFHADEVLSSALLTRLYPEAQIVRTRDPEWITPGEGKLIYDVGRAYDPAAMIFDHHQRPNPLREDGRPYSSFGLTWLHFGRAYLAELGIPQADIPAVHAAIDEGFVLPIDLLDNGAIEPGVAGPLTALTLPALLETLKPAFDNRSADADDTAFMAALPVARAVLEGAVHSKAAKLRAEAQVQQAIADAGAARVLELPTGMPFRGAIERAGADHLLFVIHPRDGDWALNTIRVSGDSFESRADLPAAWAGLTDAALEQASGVKGAKFCHNARFIAVAQSREAIVALADLAIEEAERALCTS